jgi:transmembrane sensor
MGDRESSARIDDVAALWVARIEARPLSPEEEIELDEWLAEDVRRQGAFARARAVSIHMSRAKALGPDFLADRDKK